MSTSIDLSTFSEDLFEEAKAGTGSALQREEVILTPVDNYTMFFKLSGIKCPSPTFEAEWKAE